MRIVLDTKLKRRCWEFALAVVKSYKEDKKPRSKALAGSYLGHTRADLNPLVQYAGRLGECGICQHLGISVEVLDWNTERCDSGKDLQHNGWRIDCKSSPNPRATSLVWPLDKRFLLEDAPIDLLVFIPIDHRDPEDAQPDFRGWISKQVFMDRHNVAGRFSKLHLGTWFMDQSELHHTDTFPARRKKNGR